MDHFRFQHIWHESGNILEVIELHHQKIFDFSSAAVVVTCTRVKKKFQLVQNPSVVAFSVHNLVVVAVLAHMTSTSFCGVNGLACASSTRECNKRKVGLGHNTSSLVLGSKNLAHQTVTSSPNRSDACGLQKRDYYCSSSQAYMQ